MLLFHFWKCRQIATLFLLPIGAGVVGFGVVGFGVVGAGVVGSGVVGAGVVGAGVVGAGVVGASVVGAGLGGASFVEEEKRAKIIHFNFKKNGIVTVSKHNML